MYGAISLPPKLWIQNLFWVVEERSLFGGRVTVRMPGREGSENAGMSNDKESENLSRRKPKVSWGRQIRPGLVGT